MANQWKSMLGGAAVAALLILPATAGSDWTAGPWQKFDVKTVKVDTLVGRLRVEVKPQAQVTVQVSGTKARYDHVAVHQAGDTLMISGENQNGVWDWHNWFDFSENHSDSKSLDIHVVVPKGTDLRVEDMVGDATIGDTDGDVHFEAVSSNTTIGKVQDASLSMSGSGRFVVGDVAGQLKLEIAGSGKIKVASARAVKAEIAGSGSAMIGPIAQGLKLEIAGSGDFNAAKVNGPVDVEIFGAGSVNIPQGTANPLKVEITGAGNFVFGGEAVDPEISALGSGRVKLRSYRGRMDSDGMVDVQIGPEGFPPAPAAPPSPPAPPALPKKG